MPRIYIDETAERSRNKSRREKRAHSRFNTLLHPEMERLELRITPAVRTWSGAIDNIWSNAGNWDVLPVAGDDLIFPAGASRFTTVSNFAPGTTFGSITIEDAGYAIFGNSVVLTNGVTSTHATGTSVIANDVTLTNGAASVATGGRLELEGTIGGASGLTLSGGGTLALEGTTINNYTGTTTINGGTLVVGKTGVIAIPGNVQIGDGSGLDVLQLTADDQIADGATVTIGGSGQFNMNAFDDTIGTLAFNGGTVVSGGATLGITSGLTASAGASGTSASVDLSLASGVRTFDVVDGALAVDFELSGIISGAGGIDKTSGGTLALSGANTYTGTTSVTAGVLRALNSSALGGTGSGTTVVSGATLEVAGGVAIGAEALSLAGSGVGGVGAVQSSSGTNSIAGDVTLTAGTSIGVDAGTLTLSGAIGDGGNVFGLSKLGAGTLVLGGANANTYTGTTLLHTGSLTLSKTTGPAVPGAFVLNPSTSATYTANHQVGDASNITLGTGSAVDLAGFNDTVAALDLTAATITTGAGTLTIGGNVTTQASGTASNINGNLALGGVDRTFTTASRLQVGAVVSGAGGIIKAGSAALALNGANTYSGATAINVGTVQAGHSSALGSVISGTTVASGATLELTTSTAYASEPLSITGLGDGSAGALAITGAGITTSYTGPITLDGDSRIGVTQSDSTLSIVSQITDGASTFGITKTGAGRLALTNANPFGGAMDITAGTVAASNSGSMGTGAVSVSSNSTLEVSGGVTLANTSFAIDGTGLSSAGAIRFVSGNNTINTGVTLNGNTAIVVDAGSSVISSVIAESGGARTLLKRGAGLLTLGGVNTFTGDLQVEAGEIELTGSIASDFVFNGGTLSGTGTIGNAVSVNSGTNTLSPGTGGDATGTLTVTAGAVLDTALTYEVDLEGTGAGTFDQLSAADIDLANAELVVTVGFAATIGNTFRIVDNTGANAITGVFDRSGSPLNEGASFTSGNTTFSISYVGGTGNDVVLTVTDVTYVWDGGGGDDNWTTAANWVFDAAPTAGSKLEFPTGAARLTNTNDFAADTAFHTITFSGAGYTISGSEIDLSSGISATHTSGTSEIQFVIDLTANATFSVATGGTLYINETISGGFGLTKNGAGTLTFGGGGNANTFTGTTTVDAGTLVLFKSAATDAIAGNLTVNSGTVRLDSQNQIANTSAITLGEGATLDLNGNNDTFGALGMTGASVTTGAGTLTLGGTVTTSASSTTSTIAGNVQHLVNRIYNVADGAAAVDLQISAVMSGSGFSKQGAGLLELTGTNTTIASSIVTAGTLRVGNSSALGTALDGTTVNSGATVEIGAGLTVPETFSVEGSGNGSGVIQLVSGSSTLTGAITLTDESMIGVPASSDLTIDGIIGGTFALTKVGVGYLVLNAANTYSGVTNINAGTVETGSTTALGTGNVTVASGATLSFNGFATTNPLFTIAGTGVGGVGALLNDAGANTINADVDLAANATIGVSGGTSLDITSVIGDGGNARGLTKVGAGTLVLSGTPNYTGATTVSAGLLRVDGSIATSSGVTVDSGATLGGTGTVPATTVNGTLNPGSTLAGTLTTGNLGWNASSAFGVDINGGAQFDSVSVNGTVVIDATATLSITLGYVPAIGATFTIIANDASDSITGTFAGLGEGASIVVGNTTFQITYAGGSNSNDVVLTATDVSFVWDGGGGDDFWSTAANWVGDAAPIAGVNLVFPTGASRTTNTNDFAADTNFNDITIEASGYVIIGNEIDLDGDITTTYSSSGSRIEFPIELMSSRIIDTATGGDFEIRAVISGAAAGITKQGGGTLRFAGNNSNSYNAVTVVQGGVLELQKSNSALALAANLRVVSGTARLNGHDQIGNTASVTVEEGAVFDAGGYDDTFAGITLEAGTVNLNGGTLTITTSITASNATPDGASFINGPGTIDLNGAAAFQINVNDEASIDFDLSISAVITNGGIDKTGAGSLRLGGTNTYAGTTLVSQGSILVASDGALGTTAGNTEIVNGATVFLEAGRSIAENFEIAGTGVSGQALGVISGDATITGTVDLSAASTIGAASGSSLTVSGTLGHTVGTPTLTVDNGPSGRTTLSGNSPNFEGEMVVSEGFLRLTGDNAAGSTGNTTILVSTTASLEVGGGIILPANRSITLDGLPVSGESKLINLSGSNRILGLVTISSNNSAVFASVGTEIDLNGGLAGTVDFDKNGPGVLTISAATTMSGRINVGDGSAYINANTTASSQFFVDGTLGGEGTLPNVSISSIGTLAPGATAVTPGIITLSNGLTMTAGSTFSIDIDGAGQGTQYDSAHVTGTVDLGSATLVISLGYLPLPGQGFTIINNDSTDPITGTFNGIAEGGTITVGTQDFVVSYVGGTGNDVTLTAQLRVSTWSGLGGDANWSTGANWVGGLAPEANNQLVFPILGSRPTNNNDFASGTTFHSIVIQSSSYALGGNSIDLTNGVTMAAPSGSSSISFDVELLANQTIDVSASNTLTLSGVISGAFTLTKSGSGEAILQATNTYSGGTSISQGTLEVDGAAASLGSGAITIAAFATMEVDAVSMTNTISVAGAGASAAGAIIGVGATTSTLWGAVTLTGVTSVATQGLGALTFNGVISGGFGLEILGGSGSVVLGGSGSNTYTGTTTIAGRAELYKTGGATAIAGNVTIADNTLWLLQPEQISDTSTVSLTSANATLFLNGNAETIAALQFTGGTVNTGAGTLNLNGTGVVVTTNAASTTATISGLLSIGGSPSTFSIAQGTTSSGIDLQVSAVVSGGGFLRKTGAGRHALSGVNTYAGGTQHWQGSILATNDSSLGTSAASIEATLELSGGITIANAMTMSAGGSLVSNLSGDNTLSGTISLASDLDASAATSTTLTFSGTISDGSNGYGIDKIGAGTLRLMSNNAYSGGTGISAGTLAVHSTTATGTAGTVAASAGTTLRVATATYTVPSGGLTLDGATVLQGDASSSTVDGGITLLANSTFAVVQAAGSMTIAGSITDGSGSFGFSKIGSGTLILDSANTYDGTTQITGGTLRVNNAAALGSTSGGTVIGDNATLQTGLSSNAAIAEPLTVGTSGGTGTISVSGFTPDFSGAVSLLGTLALTGSGTLEISGVIDDASGSFGLTNNTVLTTLSAANTFDGAVVIESGRITIESTGALGSTSGSTELRSTGELQFSLPGANAIAEPIVVAASSTPVISNAIGTNVMTGGVELRSNLYFNVTGNPLEVAGVISQSGGNFGVIKLGGQNLYLSAANTFDGVVEIQQGALVVRDPSALGGTTGGTVVHGNATLALDTDTTFNENLELGRSSVGGSLRNDSGDNRWNGTIVLVGTNAIEVNGGSLFLNGVISGAGGITKTGTNAAHLNATNTYAGTTGVSSGVLNVTVSGGLSTAALDIDTGGTVTLENGITITPSSINLRGSGDGNGALRSSNGSNVYAGPITLATDSSIGVTSGILTLSGAISGSSGLTKRGAGELVLAGSTGNSYTGTTSVVEGTLSLGKTSGSAVGLGTLTIGDGSGLDAVRLQGNNQIDDSVTVTVVESGVFEVGSYSDLIGPLNIRGSSVTIDTGGELGVSIVSFNSASNSTTGVISGSGTLNFASFTGQFVAADTTGVATDARVGATINGTVVTKSGAGVLAFSASNTFTSTLSVGQGTLQVESDGALSTTAGATNVSAGATVEFIGGRTLSEDFQLSGGVATDSLRAASGSTVLSGDIALNGAVSLGAAAAGSLRFDGVIDDPSNISSLIINDFTTGTVILGNTNDIQNGVTIHDGIVEVRANNAFGSTASTSINGGQVQIFGSSLATGFAINRTGTSITNVSGNNFVAGDLTLGADAQIEVVGGSILRHQGRILQSGSFDFTKTGFGTLRLEGSANQQVDTNVTDGTLEVAGQAALGTTGTVTLSASTTLTLAANDVDLPTGGLTANDSTIISTFNSSNPVDLSGTISLLGNTTLSAGSGDLLAGPITGAFGVHVEASADRITLRGTSTYTGATTLGSGELHVTGDISSSSGLTLAAGTILSGTGSLPGVVSTAATVHPGGSPGTLNVESLTLDASSTFDLDLDGSETSQYSRVISSGLVTLAGAALDVTFGFTPDAGDILTIIDNTSGSPISGTFAGLPDGTIFARGGYTMRIEYDGGSGDDVTLTLLGVTTLDLTSNVSSAVVGQTIILTADVSSDIGTPGGNVVFYVNSSPLPNGTVALQNVSGHWIATYSISTLLPGAYTFSADYAAGQVPSLLGSSDTLVPNPFLVGAAATTTLVSSSDPSSVYGESVTFTALVVVQAPGAGLPVGTVQFRDGVTVLGTSTLNSIGVATFTTSMLGASADPHSITAYFTPTSFEWAPSDSSGDPFAQTVAKAMLTVTADDASRTYGATNPTFTASYTGFVNGETLGTSGVTGSPSLTTAAVPASPVNGSPFAIDAALGSLAATNYDFTFVSGELTITKAPLLVAADDTSRPYGEANPVFTASYSGFVNGETLGTSGVTGTPSLTTTAVPTSPVIPAPYYPITAALGSLASDNYAFSFQDGQLAISQGVPNITLQQASETLRYGQPTSLTATVLSAGAGQPTGTVSFFLNSTLLGTRTLDVNGSATLSIDSLPLGTGSLVANYNGDDDFEAEGSDSLLVEVSQASTSTAISTSVVSSVFGQSVTITATVTPQSPSTSLPVTGSVSFSYDTEVLGVAVLDANGVATLTTSMLPVGTVELIATYISTSEFDTSEDREFFTINRANVSASITSSLNPSDYGQPLSFTANLAAIAPGAGIPGGMIDFYSDNIYFGSAQLVGGEASIGAPTLSVGGHTIEARYAGDSNFGPVIASLVQAIDASDVVVTAVSTGSTVFGQTAIIDVTVTPFYSTQAPSGFVTFWVDDVLIGQAMLDPMGEASFSTNALPVGSNVVTVLYVGDSRYVANSDTVTQVVAAGPTSTTLTSSDPTSVFGQSVVFMVQVAPISPAAGLPAGEVGFFVDDTPLGIVALDANGRAQITLSNLTVGTHQIEAVYSGNASFAGSSATPIEQVVSPGEAQVVITSSAPDAVFGQTFSLNVVMSGPVTPTGTVTFFDGSTSLGSSSLVDGQASIEVSNLSVGNHSITVVYSGDENYAPFTSEPITQTIAKSGSTTTLTSSTSSPVFSQPVTFTAVLSATAPGSGTPTGSVTFRNGSTVLATVPLVNGQAQFTTSGLSLGAHQINATFDGSNDFNASTRAIETSIGQAASTVLVTSSAPTAVTGQTVTYSITAYAYTPATAEPTGTVTLFDGSTAIGTATLVNARAQINVVASGAVSTKTITVRYNGSAQFSGNTSPAISQVVNQAPTSTSIAVTQARRNGVNGYLFTMNVGSVAPGSGQPTGQVGFYARSTVYRTLDLVNGVATIFLSRTTARNLGGNFAAMYNGDANFLTSVSPIIGLNGSPINGARRPTRVFRGR
ncbi:MAG: Ig-like domain repeat protein [Isosphaeraceae bacterium]|nr:Ig-like domain repeat protein [Isosphaeraceae bacterium]